MARAAICGDRRLKCRNRWSLRQVVGSQHGDDRGDVVITDFLASVWDYA
jgi:hypothetical protein